MSDIIIIYLKGSEYPQVTKQDLQKVNYISAVINVEDIVSESIFHYNKD